MRQASKIIVHEWNGYLEIFSRPQVKEKMRQYLLLRRVILHKTGSLFPEYREQNS